MKLVEHHEVGVTGQPCKPKSGGPKASPPNKEPTVGQSRPSGVGGFASPCPLQLRTTFSKSGCQRGRLAGTLFGLCWISALPRESLGLLCMSLQIRRNMQRKTAHCEPGSAARAACEAEPSIPPCSKELLSGRTPGETSARSGPTPGLGLDQCQRLAHLALACPDVAPDASAALRAPAPFRHPWARRGPA